MFNFELVNKALTDTNVNETEFRTLYLIANNCSMNNTDSIEMYNAYMMDKLHYSESTIKRCTKALEQNGYISIKRATKKKTPNIISLITINNESKDEFKNAVRNDTLYNNIDNNKNNIQSIQSNSNINEDNGIPYDVYCEQQLAKKKAKKASNVNDNSNVEMQSMQDMDILDNNSNVHDNTNAEMQSNDIVDVSSNEDIDVDAMYEAYMQGMIAEAKQSDLSQQQNNPNSIDWDAWRAKYEKYKTKLLNAKCKTDFDLLTTNIRECLNYAKDHMRPEKYDKVISTYDKWYAASEPYFYFNKQKGNSIRQGSTPKPCKVFDEGQWCTYEFMLDIEPQTRNETAREMVQYLKDCGKDPIRAIKDLKDLYGIVL